METHREEFESKNIRYLGYKWLQNVTFNDEPVVPVIISEGDDKWGMHFNVEKLGGQDLDDLMNLPDSDISLKDKLRVMKYAVLQLKAIDAAGFWIYDRAGRNVRVLSWADNRISVRQIDMEDFYDKKTDAIYSDHRFTDMEQYVDGQYELGQSPWAFNVALLASLMEDTIPESLMTKFGIDKYKRLYTFEARRNPLAKDPLNRFEKDLTKMIAYLQ